MQSCVLEVLTFSLTLGVFAVAQVPPHAPQVNITATTINSITLKLRPDPSDTAPPHGYTIQYKREFSEWEKIVLDSPVPEYTLDKLWCGSRYQVYVTAYNAIGAGEKSDNLNIRTKGSKPLIPETRSIEASSDSITLHLSAWNDGGCPMLYFVVELKKKTQVEWNQVSNNVKPGDNFIVLDLEPGTWYHLRVTAHNDAGFSVAEYEFATLTITGAKCPEGCSVPVSPYVEMNCEPVFAQPNDCCPSHYNCAKFEGRAVDKCYVKNKVYNNGETIDGNLTQPNCLAGCRCQGQDIICAHIDCPEFLGASRLGPGCYRAYDLNSCCSKFSVCPPLDKMAKCEVGGKTYHEGQKWYTDDENLRCVCKPGFKGKNEAPFCAEISCGIEFTQTQKIKDKCAPVFYGSKGCPIQWECLKEGDVVVPNKKGTTTDQTCSYGDKKLNVGDKLILKQSEHSPKINCECKIPPLVTCIQEPYNA